MDSGGLAAGRDRVRHVVGRDPASLDEAGVARAAIESLAENFSDGVVAPSLWCAVLGLPGAAAYKAVNTADSMIGHQNSRYRDFGRFAARLDDLVNLPASRLAAWWIVLAAATVPGASPGGALRAVRRDATRHRSPNAGWPEAALAGALGLRLGGSQAVRGPQGRGLVDGRRSRRGDAGRHRPGARPLPPRLRDPARRRRPRFARYRAMAISRSMSRYASRWAARPSSVFSTSAP